MIDVSRDSEQMRAYLVGQMSDDERRTFEDRLVRDPQLVREFEQSLRLRAGLQQLRAQGYFAGTSRASRSRHWLPALTAAAITGLALFLWLQPLVQQPPVRIAAPIARTTAAPILTAAVDARAAADEAVIAAQFTFVAVRGGSSVDLALPAHGLIEFRAAPALRAAGARYHLALLAAAASGTSQPIGTLDDLAPRPDGYIYGYADAARLTAGNYLLRVEGGTPASVETFRFNLRAKAAISP
jgi:hypothetical protein